MLRFLTFAILMAVGCKLGYELAKPQTPSTYLWLALALLALSVFTLAMLSWTPHL